MFSGSITSLRFKVYTPEEIKRPRVTATISIQIQNTLFELMPHKPIRTHKGKFFSMIVLI